MPFVTARPLGDLLDPRAGERAARRMADAGGDRLHANIKRRTPIDKSPGSHPGRVPGTLRESVRRGPVNRALGPAAGGFEVRVFTEDPIAPYVEWTTRPHDIPNAFGRGHDFGIGGPFGGHFHPGTRGQHMFSLGAAATEAEVHRIVAVALRDFERDLVRGR